MAGYDDEPSLNLMCQCYIFLIYQTPFLFSQWPYETRFYSLVFGGGKSWESYLCASSMGNS